MNDSNFIIRLFAQIQMCNIIKINKLLNISKGLYAFFINKWYYTYVCGCHGKYHQSKRSCWRHSGMEHAQSQEPVL